MRTLTAVLTLAALAVVAPAAHAQQLGSNCTASLLNRTVQVNADGSFAIGNVPANPQSLYRVRVRCIAPNGSIVQGQSAFLSLNGSTDSIDIGPIDFDNFTLPPVSLQINIGEDENTLTTVGQTLHLNALATYPDGTQQSVIYPDSGTTYISSNPAVATVDNTGLVTAVSAGNVTISATNEGVLAAVQLQVLIPKDTDGDGMPDDYEIANGFNPLDPSDAGQDADHDGLTNLQEYLLGTNPHNPDTDGDGVPDGQEVKLGTNPLDPDTDHDGLTDGQELALGTNPLSADTDGDGIPDGIEVRLGLNPLVPDPTTTVQGRVVDGSGNPVAGASTVVFTYFTGFTDSTGFFTIPFVPSAIGNIQVMAQTTSNGQILDGSSASKLPVSPGTTDVGTIQIGVDAGAVSGLVSDLKGKPVVGAQVTVSEGVNIRTTTTDVTGHYLVNNMVAGVITAVAMDPNTGLQGRGTAILATGQSASINIKLGATGTINGVVMKADGVTPVGGGVTVTLSGSTFATTTTDPVGRFSFTFVPLGVFTIDATDTNGNHGRTTGNLTITGETVGANVAFLGRGTVSGTVTDSSGIVVPNAAITVVSSSVFAGTYHTTTDGSGKYTQSGVFVGPYNVTAQDAVGRRGGQANGAINSDGQNITTNIKLGPAGTISGTVVRADGTTVVVGAQVSVSTYGLTTTTDSTGAYEFDLLPVGTYQLSVTDPSTGDRGAGSGTISSQGQVVTVNVKLNGQGQVVVTVIDGGGNTVSGANVSLTSTTSFGGTQGGVSQSDGTLTFSKVLAGTFDVSAVDPSTQLAGHTSGSVSVGTSQPITVQLQPAGSITGTVYGPDGSTPVSGIRIELQGEVNRTTASAANGTYSFATVPTNTYKLYAIDSYGNQRASASNVAVSTQGQQVTQDLVLIGVGTVSGQVTNPDSTPAAGIGLTLRTDAPGYGALSARTDVNGNYAIPQVPVSDFNVEAQEITATQVLSGIATGQIAANGGTATANIQLSATSLPISLTTPPNLFDGNNFPFDIAANGTIANGFEYTFAGDFSANKGAMDLNIILNSSVNPFVGDNTGVTAQSGQEIDVAQQDLAGLNVTRKIYVPNTGYFSRYLDILSNPTSSPITVGVQYTSNIRPTNTAFPGVLSTSTGNSSPTNQDFWMTVGDDVDQDPTITFTRANFVIPELAFVFQGANAPVPASTAGFSLLPVDIQTQIFSGGNSEIGQVQSQWNSITIPAGGSVAFLNFVAQQTSRAGALAAAQRLVQLPNETLTGISSDELAEIQNFAATGTSSAAPLTINANVAGTVWASDNVTPVPGATVTFQSSLPFYGRLRTTNSDGNGNYLFNSITGNSGNNVIIPSAPFTVQATLQQTQVQSPVFNGTFDPVNSPLYATQDIVFSDTGIIIGTVTRAEGEVVSSGQVALTGTGIVGSLTTNIAPDGSYSFYSVPPGQYTLIATLSNPMGTGLTGSSSASVSDGNTDTANIVIPATGNVAGTVLRSDNSAAVNVTVTLRGAAGFTRTATTDTAGRFNFSDLPVATYSLATFDPLTNTAASANATSIADQTVTQNLSLVLGGTVTGKVTENGVLVAGAQVTVVANNGTFSATTNAQGVYTVAQVAPGVLTVSAVDTTNNDQGQSTGTLGLSGQTVEIDVALIPSGSASGSVFQADGVTPVPGATVLLCQTLSGSTCFGYSATTTTNASGHYSFTGVPLIGFAIDVTNINGDRGRTTGQLSNNGQTLTLNIHLTGFGSVNVTVKDASGNLIPNAQVTLTGETQFGGTQKSTTQSNGTTQFTSVLAGPFFVSATDPVTLLGGSTSGSVAVNGNTNVTVSLQSAGNIVGVVYAPDGKTTLSNVTINLTGPTSRSTVSASDGSFSFNAIPLGSYTLQAYDTANRLRAQITGLNLNTNGQVLPVSVTETALVTSVSPSSVLQGQTVDLTVLGDSTSFTSATAFNFGAGVTVNSVNATSSTSATVNVTVSPIATTGTRSVTATSGTQVATGSNLFTVNASSAAITSVVPASGKQNTVGLSVTITGSGTHFTLATPSVSLGSGISTTQVQVLSDTSLTATVNIAPFAAVQSNTVFVTTGGEQASLANGFKVTTGNPFVASVSPINAHQGDTLNVTVNGQYTNFVGAVTQADFGAGITVNSVTVNSTTNATVNISIQPDASIGVRTVTMTTGSEMAVGTGLFTVQAGVPHIVSVSPNTIGQGVTQNVTITGSFTNFQSGVSQVTFSGDGITTGAVTVTSATILQVPVTVTLGATPGLRSVTVTTNSEIATQNNALTVQAGLPTITVISPNVGVPNSTIPVAITGTFTNFTAGNTQASFGSGISVGGAAEGVFGPVTVNSSTSATVMLTIDQAAALGSRDVIVQTTLPDNSVQMLTVNAGFTVQNVSTTPPSLVSLSPASNAQNVPVNARVTMAFNEPLNRASVTSDNIYIVPTSYGCYYAYYGSTPRTPATLTVDASGRIVTLIPSSLLAVGTTYTVCLNYYNFSTVFTDTSGNAFPGTYQQFTTGFAVDNTGPAFVGANIQNGDSTVPTNARVVLGFNEPIDPSTATYSVQVLNNGSPVNGTFGYSSDYSQITFMPTGSLAPNSNYTVSYTSGLEDSQGNPLSNPGSFSFTTAAGSDSSYAQVLSWTPQGEETTGENPTFSVVFNQPMSSLSQTVGYYNVYNGDTGLNVPGTTVSLSPDGTTFMLALSSPLEPGTQYCWRIEALNRIGNYSYYSDCFYTSNAVDTVPPAVTAVSPAAGAINVAPNPQIQVVMDKPMDATSVANSIALALVGSGSPVAGSATLASDHVTLTFTIAGGALLSPNTNYGVTMSGAKDVNGNVMTPYSWNFTTSGSSVGDYSNGTIAISIADGSTNVGVTTPIVLTFSKPVDPLTVNYQTFNVNDNTVGTSVGGAISVAPDQMSATFTPTFPYAGNHVICAYVTSYYYGQQILDVSGNPFYTPGSVCFTTASVVDNTAPAVLSIMPPDRSTGIGPNNPITVTFSKPMDPNTLYQNMALFVGSTLYTNGVSLSPDSTTATFYSGYLNYGTTYTVVIGPNVADISGNLLGTEVTSNFTTAVGDSTTHPTVTAFRPGQGATNVDPNTPLTFFINEPINPSTVYGAIHVAVNGAIITGNVSTDATNQIVTFAPSAPLPGGSTVQVWFQNSAADVFGNTLNNYYTSFTVSPDLTTTAPTVVSAYPNCCNSSVPATTVVDVQFNKPIDFSTVNSGNFYLSDCNGDCGWYTPVAIPATISQAAPNVLRLVPTSPLTVNDSYEIVLGSGILDTNGLAYAGNTGYTFTVNSASDSLQPSVAAIVPGDGATGIGDNAVVRITFNKNIDPLTINGQTITLSSNGKNIPYTFTYDNVSRATLTPEGSLPDSSPITVTVTNGVTDGVGNVLPPASATFHTAAGPNFTAPHVVASTIAYGDTNVPISSVFTLTFDRPMDTRTFIFNNTVSLQDYTAGPTVPSTLTFSSDGTQLTIAPNTQLSVGHNYYLQSCSALDLTGNTQNCYSVYFTTAVVAQTGGPQILQTVPRDGTAGLPVNFIPEVQFDRPISEPTANNVTLMGNGSSIALTPSFSYGDTVVRFAPGTLLLPNSSYSLTITGITDPAGNPASTQTVNFTTGSGIDVGYPQVVSVNPLSGSTTGTNPAIEFVFNKAIDPIRSSGAFLYNESANTNVAGTSLTFAPDLKSATITYPGSLDVNTSYQFGLGSFYDLNGNSGYGCCWYFTTGSGADTSPETVTSVVPANDPGGANPVPLNSIISVTLSKPINPLTFTQGALTITPSVPGNVTYSGDGLTLFYNLSGPLAPGTPYTISVSGFTDVDGNMVQPFTSSFVTGSATYNCCGSVIAITPADGTQNSDPTLPIVVQFDRSVYPPSVNAYSIQLFNISDNSNPIGGSTSLSTDGITLTFTPASPLPPDSTVLVQVSCNSSLTDLAGNGFYCSSAQFTTGSGATTSLQVLSVTPNDSMAGVGPGAVVTLSFNESIDPNTITTQNFQLFDGYSNLQANLTRSADNRTIMLNARLPYDSTITVIVNNGVLDLSGNPLAAPFRSSFTTIPQPASEFTPSITGMRPGSGSTGVPTNTAITLYANSPVNPSSVQGEIVVSQNGIAITGTVSVKPGGGAIVFTPDLPFANNATIQVFVQPVVTDIYGNPFEMYSAQFTTAVDYANTAPTVLSVEPVCCTNVSTSSIVDVQFSKPIDPSTVTTSNFQLDDCNGDCGWSNTLTPTNISFPSQNVIRLTPTSPLVVNSSYEIIIGTGIADLTGGTYGGGNWTFNTDNTFDTTTPFVAAVAPSDNATNIGDNATVRFAFNKLMDTISISPSTVTLASGATQLPFTESFSTQNNVTYVTLTPLSPLPDNSTVTLTLTGGITDLAGHSLTPRTVTFHTGNGPDLTPPQLVSQSVTSNQANVPVNSTFTWTFNKPLDPSAYLFVTLYSYALGQDVITTGSLSTDGFTITLTPIQPLIATTEYQLCYSNVTDMEGNIAPSSCVYFYASGTPDLTPPQLQYTVPANETTAPLNTTIEGVFDKPISPTSLGSVRLVASATGIAVPATVSVVWNNSTVRITPATLLAANTAYIAIFSGVQDLAGNTMPVSATFGFVTSGTTGTGGTQLNTTSVLVGGTASYLSTCCAQSNVDVNTTFQMVFSQPIDPASLIFNNGATLYSNNTGQLIPLTLVSLSPDLMTVTLQGDGNLTPDTQYSFRIDYNGTVYDATETPIINSAYYTFTTGNAAVAGGTPLPIYSTGLSAGGVGPLAAGAPDPNWSASNPNTCCTYNGPATVLSAVNLYPSWNADDSNSQWISWSDTINSGPPGYSFTQTFDLSGFDSTTAAFTATVWADDAAYVYLNGVQVAYVNSNSWSNTGSPGVTFSVGPNSALFLPGVNTLTVVMTSSDSSYEGIRVLIDSATAAPKSGENFQARKAIYAANRVPSVSPADRMDRAFPRALLGSWTAGDLFGDLSPIALGARSSKQRTPSPVLMNFVPLDRAPLSLYRGGDAPAIARLEWGIEPPQ